MSPARVLLGAACYAEAQAALAVAVRLAASVDAELRGLMIEDEGILALARRPGARIVGQSGRRASAEDLTRMAAALRGDSDRFARALAAAAAADALRWSFDRLAGRTAEVLAHASAPGDLLVLGGVEGVARPGRLVYLAGGVPDPALEATAARLARVLGLPLVRLQPGPSIDEALARTRADSVLVASLANAPQGLMALAGARFTRVLKRPEA